ncbi:MAG: glycosyltransferase family 2 protein [Armatimonadota bacterium]
MSASSPQAVIALIPAYQEAERIAATVTAARALPGVTRVLVVDDGSTDGTAELAAGAGAEVLCLPQNGGKGAAMRAGLAACPGADDDIFLLLDADLGETAAQADRLLQPVLDGVADLTIARFPRAGKAGFGLVKGLARTGTWLLTRRVLQAPISGQRACRRWVLQAAPIADGYGAEVAMNIAAGDAGARIIEVPVEMTHAATGRNLAGFKHRGKQFAHIFGALAAAAFGRTGERLITRINIIRLFVWLAAVVFTAWFTLHVYHHGSPPSKRGFFIFEYSRLSGILLPVAVILGPLLTAKLSGLFRARRKNYRNRYIPALGGLLLLPVSAYLVFTFVSVDLPERDLLSMLFLPFTLIGWMLLGLIDDLWGTTERKGFRGHLGALLRGRLTSGGVKLLGGGLLALAMGLFTVPGHIQMDFLPAQAPPRWLSVPVAAILIALSANALNLFDLRPGRALKVYWSSCAFIILIVLFNLTVPVYNPSLLDIFLNLAFFVILLATLVYAPFDFAGMMMLGDTGANPLGAFLGLCLALLLPAWGQGITILLLIGLHVYAERASITKLIERVPVLNWFDRLGRSE